MRSLILCLLLLTVALRPQAVRADSVERVPIDTVRFTPAQLIVPGAMIAVGALGVSIGPFVKARTWLNNEIGIHDCAPADDILQYLPLATYLALDYAGVKARRPVLDRLVNVATGAIIAGALTQGTKHLVSERRPTGEHCNSFPSGHTATAFLGAELLRQDYGGWAGAGGYVVASAVGVMRLLNGRHWLNDVVAGAGIGILSARAAEWLLPLNRRWLRLDRRRGEAALIIPTVSPASGTVALTAAFVL